MENPDLTMKVDMTLEQQLMEKFPSKLVITLPEENYPEKVSVIELEGILSVNYEKNFLNFSISQKNKNNNKCRLKCLKTNIVFFFRLS